MLGFPNRLLSSVSRAFKLKIQSTTEHPTKYFSGFYIVFIIFKFLKQKITHITLKRGSSYEKSNTKVIGLIVSTTGQGICCFRSRSSPNVLILPSWHLSPESETEPSTASSGQNTPSPANAGSRWNPHNLWLLQPPSLNVPFTKFSRRSLRARNDDNRAEFTLKCSKCVQP